MVTGGAGFIGSNLVRSLVCSHESEVLIVDKLTYAGNTTSLQGIPETRYQLCVADIGDSEKIDSAIDQFRPELIMHLAAESHVDRSIDAPADFIDSNICGTFRLLQSARRYFETLKGEVKSNFRFLQVSTDEVYGSLDADSPAFCEITPYAPRSPYAASKASADHLATAWFHTFDLPVIVSHSSNNYGPFQHPEKLIPVVILNALQGQPIPVYGDGSQIRDWLFVDDHVDALVKLVHKGSVGERYNIGGNNERTNLQVVSQICNLMDQLHPPDANEAFRTNNRNADSYKDLITFVQDRPGHDFRYALDSSKLNRELDWKPKVGFDGGIETTTRWYLRNTDWWTPHVGGERP